MGNFSFDFSQMLTIAGQIFNALVPVIIIGGGISLGIMIGRMILSAIRSIS